MLLLFLHHHQHDLLSLRKCIAASCPCIFYEADLESFLVFFLKLIMIFSLANLCPFKVVLESYETISWQTQMRWKMQA